MIVALAIGWLLLSDAGGLVGTLGLLAVGVASLLWWVDRDAAKMIASEGDVVILRGPGIWTRSGPRLAVPWGSLVRVRWLGRHPLWTGLAAYVQVELQTATGAHRFTVPVPLVHRRRARFGSTDPHSAFRRACIARGVEVLDDQSDLAPADSASDQFSSWAVLHDAVRREPHCYGGVYQGSGGIGVLQVVPGRTRLAPGRHYAARVAQATDVAAGDLMEDVDVVECRFSRAELSDARDRISRMQRDRPELGITDVQIVDRDNVVEVGLDRLGVLVATRFDQFGDLVRLVERPGDHAERVNPPTLRWRAIATFAAEVLVASGALLGLWWWVQNRV